MVTRTLCWLRPGSGLATFGLPDSAGVPASVTCDTIVLPYNDLDAVSQAMRSVGGEVACVLVEPVAGNMGVVPPKPGYLSGLRELANQAGALLVFDEVITGFRVSYGGAQELYGVTPDLTTLGKIIGGGLPVGAYGGRREIMEQIAPVGPVYQAGTLSGNPIAVSAGIATLKAPKEPGFYDKLDASAETLASGLMEAAAISGVKMRLNRVGSMMTAFFTGENVLDYASAKRSDTAAYARFFGEMLERGIYLAPSGFEAAFVSSAHTQADISATIEAAREGFRVLGA